MDDIKKKIDEMKKAIEQLRDEAKLQAHLGKTESQEALSKLEDELAIFLKDYKPFADEAKKTFDNTSEALGLAADELLAGVKRVRKLF